MHLCARRAPRAASCGRPPQSRPGRLALHRPRQEERRRQFCKRGGFSWRSQERRSRRSRFHLEGVLLLLLTTLVLAAPSAGRPSERVPSPAEELVALGDGIPETAITLGEDTERPSEADVAAEGPAVIELLEAVDPSENEVEEVEPTAEDALLEARHAQLIAAGRPLTGAHTPTAVKIRNPRYFPLGLPGSGVGGGIGGGGYQRLFGAYPSLFGGTYFSMLGGVSEGGPFPYPPVPAFG
ncbi:uncharacterized protein LOC122386722 [Amphibalanus amphitrite]|uniref:uncharacterized protein LOC122386722 n=1 Tax=Amphibalanus amphitrite TaxID=1232801 RepID=UPI001C92524B|nr:uncharacterized protein LOC122386722 [Amphibalanus amphitrite]